MKKAATVRIKMDGMGHGEIVINGIHMEKVVSGTRLFTQPQQGTVLQIDIVVDSVEVDGEDIHILLRELRPENEPLKHQIKKLNEVGAQICSVCRQVVGNPKWNPDECPGPLASKS